MRFKWRQPGKTDSTNGEWKQIVVENILPRQDTVGIYINLVDSVESVWLDDVRLEQTGLESSQGAALGCR